MVARENENIFGVISFDEIDVLVNGVRRSFIPFGSLYLLIRGKNMYSAVGSVKIPRLTVADIVVKLQRLILSQNADGINAGINAVGKRKIDDAVFAAVGHGRLCDFFRQNAEAAALTAGKKHSYAFGFYCHEKSSLYIKRFLFSCGMCSL